MAKKKLKLFEFASCAVAKASAGAAKVVRCEMADADPFGISLYGGPDHVGSYARSQFRPVSPDPPKNFAFTHACIGKPSINECFAPIRNGHCSQPSRLAEQIDDHPMSVPRLQLIQSQSHDF